MEIASLIIGIFSLIVGIFGVIITIILVFYFEIFKPKKKQKEIIETYKKVISEFEASFDAYIKNYYESNNEKGFLNLDYFFTSILKDFLDKLLYLFYNVYDNINEFYNLKFKNKHFSRTSDIKEYLHKIKELSRDREGNKFCTYFSIKLKIENGFIIEEETEMKESYKSTLRSFSERELFMYIFNLLKINGKFKWNGSKSTFYKFEGYIKYPHSREIFNFLGKLKDDINKI